MRTLHALLAAALLSACAQNGSDQTPPPSLTGALAPLQMPVPGSFSGVVLVGEGDTLVYEQAFGAAAPGRDMTMGDNWRWASVTKQIVAVLVMQEVEAGRLALSDTIADRLPDFDGPSAAGITIEQLLRHRSGLPNPEASPPDANGVPSFYSVDEAARTAVESYCEGPPKSASDVSFDYNNCDFIVLGQILESVTGETWTDLFRERIAVPLGMTSVNRYGEGAPETVLGIVDRAPEPKVIDIAAYGAAAALVGAPRDLARFDAALMAGQLLSPASLEVLWSSSPELGYAALGAWSFPAALKGCDGDIALVERRGWIGAIQVRHLLAPERGRSLVVFTNEAGVEFGEIWMGQGLAFDLASAAFCG